MGAAAVPLPKASLDITDPNAVQEVIAAIKPSAVINCAAWTAVDAAEKDSEACYAVNRQAPASLATACNEAGATLVHVSTDYVFGSDAKRRAPYAEDDTPGPLSTYGASKLAGELAAQAAVKHLVIRTCGLYAVGESGPIRGRNFADTMLALARDRGEVKVVSDQTCTPSYVPHVAAAMIVLLRSGALGVFHVTNSGSTSWHRFAEELFRAAGKTTVATPISWREYASSVVRPSYSVLSTRKLRDTIGTELPDWRQGLAEYVALARNAYTTTERIPCAQFS